MFQVTQETSKAHRVHAKLRQDAIKSTCAKFKRADQVDPPMSAIVFDFDFFAFQSPWHRLEETRAGVACFSFSILLIGLPQIIWSLFCQSVP